MTSHARSLAVFCAALASCVVGCSDDDPVSVLTPTELTQLQGFSPLPAVPADLTNRYADNAAAARLGQRFFFDKAFSGPLTVGDDGTNGGLGAAGESGRVACASCHLPPSFIDTRSRPNNVSLGGNWGRRNATSIVNAAHYRWINSDGSAGDALWASMRTTEGAGSHNTSRLRIAHLIFDRYRAEYDAVFTPPLDPALAADHPEAARFPADARPGSAAWNGMTAADQLIVNTIFANFGKAMAAYMRLLVSGDSPFDRFVAGDRRALSVSAQRGAQLFVGKGACAQCHSGPLFSDNAFHNIGVPQAGFNIPATDEGRWGAIPGVLANQFGTHGAFSDNPGASRVPGLQRTDDDRGRFRTATLRNIAETAPYMHTGGLATLEEVIEFYNQGGASSGFSGTKSPLMLPLGLTEAEKADLVAFLKSLTGQQVPSNLQLDTSAR